MQAAAAIVHARYLLKEKEKEREKDHSLTQKRNRSARKMANHQTTQKNIIEISKYN
jgi:hypothetical protein